jgi:hypothetical protein
VGAIVASDGELDYVTDDSAQPAPADSGAAIGGRLARYRDDLGGGPLWRDSEPGAAAEDVTDSGYRRKLAALKPFTSESARQANQMKAERVQLREQLRAEALVAGIVAGVASLVPNVDGDLTATAAIGDALGQLSVDYGNKRQVQAMALALKYLAPQQKQLAGAGSGSSVQLTVTGDAADRLSALLLSRMAGGGERETESAQ